MITDTESWVPPKSPHGLIQEDLWPDEWKILVSCLMLNMTTRKQVDGVIHEFFARWPNPEALVVAGDEEIQELIRPLGMQKKRSKTLLRFTREYLAGGWKDARDLYGIGKYGDDAHKIFCVGNWQQVEPNDHALNDYHRFLRRSYVEAA
jgi:methyl-CpG-binding domain protein 4